MYTGSKCKTDDRTTERETEDAEEDQVPPPAPESSALYHTGLSRPWVLSPGDMLFLCPPGGAAGSIKTT